MHVPKRAERRNSDKAKLKERWYPHEAFKVRQVFSWFLRTGGLSSSRDLNEMSWINFTQTPENDHRDSENVLELQVSVPMSFHFLLPVAFLTALTMTMLMPLTLPGLWLWSSSPSRRAIWASNYWESSSLELFSSPCFLCRFAFIHAM